MKPRIFSNRRSFFPTVMTLAGFALLGSPAHAATYYWDTNSNSGGFGTTAGTWGSSGFWGTVAAGTGATANTGITTSDDINFGTATNGLTGGGATVGIATTKSVHNITFGSASSAVTLSGGTSITLGGTTPTITVNNAADTIDTVIAGTSLTKAGTGTLTLSATDNTYTGTTIVENGALTLSGNRSATSGAMTVGSVTGQTGTLNIQGNLAFGASSLSVGTGTTSIGIVNHTAGTVSFTGGAQILIGNGTSTGTYNLNGGTINTANVTNRGVILGTNTGTTATFNLISGRLNVVTDSALQIGRSDNTANNTTNLFNQTGGIATVGGTLRIGGSGTTSTAVNSTMTIAGGTFSATSFDRLALGNNDVAVINLNGGTTTLPAFSTARGTGATATLNFDGGTLSNNVVSAAYLGGLTNAFIKVGGATINTAFGNITVTQNLLTDVSSTGGGLTKAGGNALTLTGTSTYTGATTISGGTLALSGTGVINTSSSITINGSGAKFLQNSSVAGSSGITLTQGTLDGIGTVGAVTVADLTANKIANGNLVASTALILGSLTLGGDATFDIRTAGTAGLIVTGALTTTPGSGIALVNVTSAPTWLNGSTYNLISYGSFGGSITDFTQGTIAGLGARQTSALVLSGNNVALSISGDSIRWTGAAGTAWTTSAVGTPFNWKTVAGGVDTEFLVGDDVIFNDSATGAGTVSVDVSTANVAPNSIAFSNATRDYNLTGSVGVITGTTGLSKTGAATVTLNMANTYTGATSITNGTLAYGVNDAIGSGSVTVDGALAVLSLGTLDDTVGAVSLKNGASITGSGTLTATSFAVESGNINPILAGTGVALTKTTSGTVTLTGPNTFTGATNLKNGTLVLSGGNNRLSSGGSVVIGDVATTGKLVLGDATAASDQTLASLTTTGLGGSVVGGNAFSDSVLTLNNASAVTYGGSLGGAGTNENNLALTKLGAGTLTLSSTNTYTGATTISAGTLSVGLAANMGAAASNLVFDGGTLQITGTTVTNFSGIGHTVAFNAGKTVSLDINDVANVFTADQVLNQTIGGFSKSGAGTAILDQSNTYTGITTVNQGTLTLQNNQSAATGGFNVGSNVAAANPILNIGTGSTTTVEVASGKAFQIGSNGTGGIDAVVNVADLATVNNAGTLTIGRRGVLNVNSGATWNQSGDLTVRGWGNVSAGGQGRATLTVGSGGTFNYSGVNTIKLPVVGGTPGPFTGDNPGIVIQGTFSTGMGFESDLTQAGTSSTTNGLTIDGGTLKFTASVADIATATGQGATFPILVTLTNAAKIDTQTYNVGSSSKIGGTGSLTKLGSGTLTLTGTNTYTGSTMVDAGKLVVGVASVGSITSNVSVAAGAILGGSGTITGNVTLATNVGATPGGQLTVGNSPGVMTVVGTSTFNSGSIFSWDLTDNVNTSRGTNYDGLTSTNLTVASGAIFQVVLGGSVDRSDAFWNSTQNWTNLFSVSGTTTPAGVGTLFDTFQIVDNTTGSLFTPVNGSFSFTGSTLTWSAVPEPSSILAGLLLGAGLLRRRR